MKLKKYLPYILFVLIGLLGLFLPIPTNFYVWIVGIIGVTVLHQLL